MLYAPRPFNNSVVCVRERVNGYEISISLDDSCGALCDLSRGDLRVYRLSDDRDVTREFFPNTSVVLASIDNMYIAASIARGR